MPILTLTFPGYAPIEIYSITFNVTDNNVRGYPHIEIIDLEGKRHERPYSEEEHSRLLQALLGKID